MNRRQLITWMSLAPIIGCRPTPTPPATESSARAAHPDDAPLNSVRIAGVPHVRQKPDFCGEAAAAAYLQALGVGYDQDQVFSSSGMDPARGMGATTRELRRALERIGFDVGPVWHHVRAAQAGTELSRVFEALHADLCRDVPSIVCMRFDERPNTTEHFRLVLGYDAERREVSFHDPALDNGAYRRMPLARVLSLWPLKYERERWSVIRLRLQPRSLAPPPALPKHSPADFAQHVMKLRSRLPEGFSLTVERPFVVLGDDPPARVRDLAAGTVRWAVRMLEQDYFSEDPDRILDVWLFRDRASYRRHTRLLFDERPSTPYGYYSQRHGALIMNIATGGGTLVHEIVHPYMEANFPSCPAWFNEGLGSLYEQSAERDGHIVGLTNWRLAGLQAAIRAGQLPSFERLTATSEEAFYGRDPGTHYAQARYLLYYLQQQGLLVTYFRRFRAARRIDPSGYRTLRGVLGDPDMHAFEARWKRFVLGLRFRG